MSTYYDVTCAYVYLTKGCEPTTIDSIAHVFVVGETVNIYHTNNEHKVYKLSQLDAIVLVHVSEDETTLEYRS